jgi:Na+-transporting methylmalonyl-CoA/oxaloacetate decarboxylase gamma subunit
VLIASAATTFTIGLLITFLGIGVIANVLIVYAVVQVMGERSENAEHRDGA